MPLPSSQTASHLDRRAIGRCTFGIKLRDGVSENDRWNFMADFHHGYVNVK